MCMPTCTHLCRKGELNQNIWDNFPEGLTLSRKLPKSFAVLYINCKGNGGLEMVYFTRLFSDLPGHTSGVLFLVGKKKTTGICLRRFYEVNR